MTVQYKTMTLFGLAALAAGPLGTASPAAAGLPHPAALIRTAAVADHNDWNNGDHYNWNNGDRRDFGRQQDLRRDQILRRQEERRQEERRQEERRREEFRRHEDHRDFRGNDRFDGDRHDDRGFRDNR